MRDGFDFIHIGLPKCASTSLQILWGEDPSCTFASLGKVSSYAREITFSSGPDADTFPNVSLNIELGSGENKIGSSEGLTWAFMDEPNLQYALSAYHRTTARLLGESKATDKILIVIRDPVDWIHSAHAQHIKTGGYYDVASFLEENESFVSGVLDLSSIISAWSGYFENVVIIPVEYLKRDPERFWRRYEEGLGVSRPLGRGRSIKSINKTPWGSLQDLASINKLMSRIQQVYGELEEYRKLFPEEYEKLSYMMSRVRKWVPRRIAEYAPAGELSNLASGFSAQDSRSFNALHLSSELSEHLLESYVEVMRKHLPDDWELVEEYRSSVARCSRDGI